MRGLEKVRAEFSLTALAYNLRRAITIIGVPGLIRAVQAWSSPSKAPPKRPVCSPLGYFVTVTPANPKYQRQPSYSTS
jgi:hypothetical protein